MFGTISSRKIKVSWSEPTEKNGVITEYKVAYGKAKEYDVTRALINLPGLKLSSELIDLIPFTEYTVQVKAFTKAGEGSWSDKITARTQIEGKVEP